MSHWTISRSIRGLERLLRVELIARSDGETELTESGEKYFRAAQLWTARLRAAGRDNLRGCRIGVTIGSCPDVAGLILLPMVSRLNRLLGEEVDARIIVHGDGPPLPAIPVGPDIILDMRMTEHADEHAVEMLTEELVPVASSTFLERFGGVLADEPCAWSGVPRLDTTPRRPDLATWETWFGAHACNPPPAPVATFDNYIDVLRAAADGRGVAIGWNGFVTEYIRARQLRPLRDEWLKTKRAIYGVPTSSGKRNQASRTCLGLLSWLIAERHSPRPVDIAGMSCQ